MAPAKKHSELIAWQKAMGLVEAVYLLTRTFPRDETYGLTAQLRRAVVSVASNIAEGHGRTGCREFLHHLSIARGSLSEVETQVEIALRLGYIVHDQATTVSELTSETGRVMNGLIASLERRSRGKLTSDLWPLASGDK